LDGNTEEPPSRRRDADRARGYARAGARRPMRMHWEMRLCIDGMLGGAARLSSLRTHTPQRQPRFDHLQMWRLVGNMIHEGDVRFRVPRTLENRAPASRQLKPNRQALQPGHEIALHVAWVAVEADAFEFGE